MITIIIVLAVLLAAVVFVAMKQNAKNKDIDKLDEKAAVNDQITDSVTQEVQHSE